MYLDPKENRFRRLSIAIVSRLLACLVALSFLAILVPVGTASAEQQTLMACCIGKKAGHCESGLSSKKSAPQHDHNTIVADGEENGSHDSSLRTAAESTAVRNPCSPECCGTVSTVRPQQKRERGTAQAKVRYHAPAAIVFATGNTPASVSSSAYLSQISPRGPPASLL
jgi:hypothetical protein